MGHPHRPRLAHEHVEVGGGGEGVGQRLPGAGPDAPLGAGHVDLPVDPLHVAGPVDQGAGDRQGPLGVVRREDVGPVVGRAGVEVDAVQVDVRGQAVDNVAVPVVHAGQAAADQPQAGFEPPQLPGPPPGLRHVLRRGAPAVVHLAAEAPVPDAVGAAAVLDPGQRLVQGAVGHVEAEHRLGLAAPGLVRLAGPAHAGRAEIAHGGTQVTLGTGAGEAAEDPRVDQAGGPFGQHVDPSQGPLPSARRGLATHQDRTKRSGLNARER